jgi:hypothetical protein
LIKGANMRVITVNYNERTDETKVLLTDAFKDACGVTQLDVLQDVIGSLTREYEALLSPFNKT